MMDFSESTKILFNRIQEIEPENVTKIIGYLLLQDHGEQEVARLASAPEALIYQFILKAKSHLQQISLPSPIPSSPSSFSPIFSPSSNSRPFSSSTFHSWDHNASKHHNNNNNSEFLPLELPKQAQFLSLEDQIEQINSGVSGFPSPNDVYYPDSGIGCLNSRPSRRSISSLSEFPIKTCHYFLKGFCKHGTSCRYFHGHLAPENFSQVHGNDSFGDDHLFSPGSLEQLEVEIIELLKSRRGNPVSIASLPAMYYEKYGKYLQAEGYLTESQRHGKAGYSLTKLLARLKNSIRLIDSRPHGQHAVILAEDSQKFFDNRSEKSDPGPIVSGSRQIYLTFPAESTFTEEDVSNYFNTFGTVEDVRIPCQQKRMFGFVTFAIADTVKMILAKGNPHFVCGARVLVKPYREKSKLVDRKYSDRFEAPVYYSPHYSDMEAEFHSISRSYENSRLLRRQFMEQHERALELETRRLSGMHLAGKPVNNQPFFGYSMDELKVSEDQFTLPSTDQVSRLLDVLNCGSTSDDKFKHTDTHFTDQESQALNLPDSPFASSIASGISTVI
ncbi:zinc finger CCCH domain-containing protein 18 isoform X1 [Morus notabilis]|uniref:zinc finger CCCH domain-containing protein 18 isoform X1 n=1 Tax=Morus notabilis TaxID=981085 RepID=UPI000CED60EF|nr:zinc finger CCCH domain-containing protein 18 isoform X1 [Morus notabilis]XP_024021938.1 zinc finger CCCH domain-containing protein 18 isoform X1 [Morus notabilis]